MKNAEFQESLDIFNDFLNEWNIEPLTENEAQDWGIVGGESISKIRELASDLRSEEQSCRAEANDSYRQFYESDYE